MRRSVCYIKYPKFSEKGVAFSHDSQYLAVLERRDCKDWLSIYWVGAGNPSAAHLRASASGSGSAGESVGWALVKTYPVDTEDCADVQWSPDDRVLCVYDSPLSVGACSALSPAPYTRCAVALSPCCDAVWWWWCGGGVVWCGVVWRAMDQYNILVYTADGRKLARFSAYDHALGIKTVAFSPASQFLSVGSYDEAVRLFNHVRAAAGCVLLPAACCLLPANPSPHSNTDHLEECGRVPAHIGRQHRADGGVRRAVPDGAGRLATHRLRL